MRFTELTRVSSAFQKNSDKFNVRCATIITTSHRHWRAISDNQLYWQSSLNISTGTT
jgi:hypothetical protein